jgi:hypothetical protein
MQNDTPPDETAKPQSQTDAKPPTSQPQATRREIAPDDAAEIDRFIDKHRRLLEKLA